MLGWGGATTDAIFTLQPVLHSRNDKGDGDYNWGNYKDEKFDAMIDEAKGDTDPKHRQETINKAMKYFHDHVLHDPAAPAGDPVGVALQRGRDPPRRQLAPDDLGQDQVALHRLRVSTCVEQVDRA